MLDALSDDLGGRVRDQYAGDVSDILKVSFLRALAEADRTLGVAWYYAPGDDGRRDGRHVEWREELAWRLLDAELCAGLAALPERSIVALEQAQIWPKGTLFHREPISTLAKRDAWSARMRMAVQGADIVFLDPDNGVGKETTKHATISEIRLLQEPGRAIAFITFPGRNIGHDALVRQMHERMIAETDAKRVITLRTNVSVPSGAASRSLVPRPRWFTVLDPDAILIQRAQTFAGHLKRIPRVSVRWDETS